ncbi:MAG: flagellar biosynthesis protein FlhB [Pseudomonadota bacterium]
MADGNDNDEDQKTEAPTERKLEQAREKGQVPISKEIINWFFILTSCVVMLGILPYMARSLMGVMQPFLSAPDQMILDHDSLKKLGKHLFTNIAPIVAFPLVIMFVVLIIVGFMQVGTSLSLSSLKPKMSRLSLKQGVKKIFSKNAVVEFLKTVFKTVILFAATFWLFSGHSPEIKNWTGLTFRQMFNMFEKLLFKLFMMILVILFFLGLLDYLYQRYQHTKGLRMTKQEVKEEHKDIEGDPAIKQRIRRLRMERSRNRMMKDVPTATVVITNPTHYSVALAWDPDTMDAPKVVAKGQDFVALKIREVAKEHNVPIIENPPVARALFNEVEISQDIPSEYYKAIADIIRLVMKLKSNRF